MKSIKNIKKIIIIVSVLILFAVILLFIVFSSKEENVSSRQNETKIEKKYTYSRVTFFLKKKNKASLNIPQYWEGNYRIREKDNIVDFLYLKDGKEDGVIFSIKLLDRDEKINSKDKILFVNDKFYYLLIDNNTEIKDKNFQKMHSDLEGVLKSFKVSR